MGKTLTNFPFFSIEKNWNFFERNAISRGKTSFSSRGREDQGIYKGREGEWKKYRKRKQMAFKVKNETKYSSQIETKMSILAKMKLSFSFELFHEKNQNIDFSLGGEMLSISYSFCCECSLETSLFPDPESS